MKKLFLFSFLVLFFYALSAQEEVTINITRKKIIFNSGMKLPVYVNGTEVARLRNGETFSYKASLDALQPISVMVKSGLSKREIVFVVDASKVCNIETGFPGGMLDLTLVSGGKIVPGTGMSARTKVNQKDLSVSYTMTQTLASDTIRLQWLEKGGTIMGMSYLGGLTYLSLNKPAFSMTGFGGQVMITASYLKFKVPENKPGIRSWSSAVLGYTLMDQFSSSTTKLKNIDPGLPIETEFSSTSMNVMLSLNGGYTIGLGKFKNETKWKGAALELTYRPSIVMTIPQEGETNVSFNATGFGFDINFNSFTSNAAKLAPKAQSKITLFILPPVKDMPLYINVGYGLTFYRKIGR